MQPILLPIVVLLAGLIIYGYADGKASEVGRLAYACGLLVTLIAFAAHWVKF